MGAGCSSGKKQGFSSGFSSRQQDEISGSTTERTLVNALVWNPFKVSRQEAEELLILSQPGSFLFSHDITSDLFVSMNVGKYVCHHAIFNLNDSFSVGGRSFNTLAEAVEFYKEHPLGETTLTKEYAIMSGECREKVMADDQIKKISNGHTELSTSGESGHSTTAHVISDEGVTQTADTIIEESTTILKPNNDRKTPLPGLYYRETSTSSGKELPLNESFASLNDKQALIR